MTEGLIVSDSYALYKFEAKEKFESNHAITDLTLSYNGTVLYSERCRDGAYDEEALSDVVNRMLHPQVAMMVENTLKLLEEERRKAGRGAPPAP